MAIFYRLFLKYLLLIIVVFVFECVFSEISRNVFLNLIENIFFAIFLILPICFFKTKQLKKIYVIISFSMFSVILFFETSFYYLFKTTFSESAFFIAFDTNSQETKEFVGFYLNDQILLMGFAVIVITALFLIKISKSNFDTKLYNKNVFLGILILIFLKFSGLIIYNLPYMFIKSVIAYKIELSKLGDFSKNKLGDFKNVNRKLNSDEAEIHVIVIGESTSRSHLGIYNYYRNTTPMLNNMLDSLWVYNKVISPEPYTLGSLTKVLTLGNYENPEEKYKGSLVHLLNQAGFKTFWISAQKPLGANDSHVTKIGMSASESYFMNIKNAKEQTMYDEVLVNKMKYVMSKPGEKKVIFLHTLGTHMNYKNRYPEAFNFFTDIPKSKFKGQLIYNQINAYDNAVRYTDYILATIINEVNKKNVSSTVLYFSDHGEEVYDDIEFAGHYRDELRTKNVFEIPLILWQSSKFKNHCLLANNLNKKYMIDDLFHSIADLYAIEANEIDETRSIFSSKFKARKRIVFDTIDYDGFFK